MAAIDKMYLKNYWDFDELRTWAIINKPSLLNNIFYPFDRTEEIWEQRKEKEYQYQQNLVSHFFEKHPTFLGFVDHAGSSSDDKSLKDEWTYMCNLEEKLENKIEYLDTIDFPVASFRIKQDKWLFWHCPLDFIREYLTEQCGYKERWYHKLLFKFTMKK